jgi:archaellum biogenesis ATPase FlaH
MGSPVLVEDGNARGKSVLTRQIMYGVMKQGLSVTLFTTGSTTRRFIKHFGSIRLAVSHYLGPAYLKELRPGIVGFTWNKKERGEILPCLIHNIRNSSMVQVAII